MKLKNSLTPSVRILINHPTEGRNHSIIATQPPLRTRRLIVPLTKGKTRRIDRRDSPLYRLHSWVRFFFPAPFIVCDSFLKILEIIVEKTRKGMRMIPSEVKRLWRLISVELMQQLSLSHSNSMTLRVRFITFNAIF